MNNKLKPYDEYKNTNLLWIESVPEHWKIIRNKNVMVTSKDTVGKNHNNYVLLSLTKKGIIVRDMENAKGKFPKEFDTYQIVHPGEIVFCLFDIDETPRTVGLSTIKGMITSAYTVFKIKDINQKYLYYYYLSIDNNKKLKPLYTGLRKVINTDTFLRIKMPYPPLEEQDQIVKYLDFKLAKINKFIESKKKLISALKEQKQAVINEAVTKGINPNIKMKPSGIKWLGDIPEHWMKCKLKYLGKFKSGECITSLEIDETGKYPVYGGNGLRGYCNKYTHDDSYLLIGRQGALCGNIHLVKGKFWASEHAIVVTPNTNIDIYWGKYLMKTMNLNQYSQSAAQPGLAVEKITKLCTILPPKSEQKDIVKYIKQKTQIINKTILHSENEIKLITEYRTRLISDVVTGKIDVRHIQIDDIIQEDTEIYKTDEINRDEILENNNQ